MTKGREATPMSTTTESEWEPAVERDENGRAYAWKSNREWAEANDAYVASLRAKVEQLEQERDEYRAASIAKADLTVEQHDELQRLRAKVEKQEAALRELRDVWSDRVSITEVVDAVLGDNEKP
jgi:hypothetical protein